MSTDRPGAGRRTSARRSRQRARVLVTGATGFVGRALVAALLERGHAVRATTARHAPTSTRASSGVRADVSRPADLPRRARGRRRGVLPRPRDGERAADYAEEERRGAAAFAREAERAGVRRIVYLGGVAPRGRASKHLASRLAVGEVLRAGRVPTLELRASMIVGPGSASWRIVRDLAMRLPGDGAAGLGAIPVVPHRDRGRDRGARGRARRAAAGERLVRLPGPEVLSVREILEGVAALRGRSLPAIEAPLPHPRISALWLKLVSDAPWQVVRELVQGLSHDLLPRDDRYWALAGLPPRTRFEDAARAALAEDQGGARRRPRAPSCRWRRRSSTGSRHGGARRRSRLCSGGFACAPAQRVMP